MHQVVLGAGCGAEIALGEQPDLGARRRWRHRWAGVTRRAAKRARQRRAVGAFRHATVRHCLVARSLLRRRRSAARHPAGGPRERASGLSDGKLSPNSASPRTAVIRKPAERTWRSNVGACRRFS